MTLRKTSPDALSLVPLLLALSACSVAAVSEVPESEANRVVRALSDHGIAAEKTPLRGSEAFRVEVPGDDSARAAAILANAGLPQPNTPGVLEALGGGGLVPSRTAEHERLLVGIAGDLERSLREVPGVTSARVHLAVPRGDPLGAATPLSPTAAVLIRHQGARAGISEADVRRLVANAVPGLSAESVAVIDVAAADLTPPTDLVRLGPVTTTRATATKVRLILSAMALANLALVSGLAMLWMRVRRQRPRASPAGAQMAREPR